MVQRVKFYSTADLSISFFFPRIEEILSLYLDLSTPITNFADAIELKNIIKILESGIYNVSWTEEYLDRIETSIPNLKKIYSFFFGTASSEIIKNYMMVLKDESEYRKDFFEIFAKFNYASKIPEKMFSELFWQSGFSLRHLLTDDYFCTNYPDFINEAFLSKTGNLEILLDNFIGSNSEKYFIPRTISQDEWNLLLEDYIHDSQSNLNYLRLLLQPIKGLGKSYFHVTDRQKLEVQKISNAFNESFSKSDLGLQIIFEVFSDKEKYEKKNLEYGSLTSNDKIEIIEKSILNSIMRSAGEKTGEQLTIHMTSLIDRKELRNHMGTKELFSKIAKDELIFSDKNMLLLPSFPNKESLEVSRSIGISTQNSYNITQFFNIKQQQIIFHLIAYQKILKELNLSIEKLVDWFFFDYLSELEIFWLPFSFSLEDDSTDNKTSTVFKNEEKIRKQYKLFIENGEIDLNLYNIQDSTPPFEDLPSTVSKKYAFVSDNEEIQAIMRMLFSDQSHLNFIDEHRNAKTLVDLILNQNLKKEDFLEYQQSQIQYLIDNKILLDGEKKLCFVNDIEVELLKELYWFGDTSYINSSVYEKEILDKLNQKGMVGFSNNLFSRGESDFLNFLVNNKKFDNSWGIRNKYQHGSPAYPNEQQYNFDYSIALLVLIICVVKIDEEIKWKSKN